MAWVLFEASDPVLKGCLLLIRMPTNVVYSQFKTKLIIRHRCVRMASLNTTQMAKIAKSSEQLNYQHLRRFQELTPCFRRIIT